jgi:hypothetical protein
MHLLEHHVSPYVQLSVLVNEALLFENSNFQWYIEVECLWKSQQMLGQIWCGSSCDDLERLFYHVVVGINSQYKGS